MNTDREILELAAKAAGIDAEWHEELDVEFCAANEGMWLKGARSPDNSKYWNPLTDDGDALRLAVTLRMELDLSYPEARAKGTGGWVDIDGEPGDMYEDTRRAIVRAAAEIARTYW